MHRHILPLSVLLLTAFLAFACKGTESTAQLNQPSQSAPPQDSTAPQSSASQPPTAAGQSSSDSIAEPAIETVKSVYEIYTHEDHLSYQGYELSIGSKRAARNLDGAAYPREVAYSILKQGRRVIKKFEWSSSSLVAPNFGLFDFLGGGEKELLIGQSLSKSGRFWIVSLRPNFRILLDTADYGAGREEPGIIDIDQDGAYEMIQAIWDFDGIKSVATVNTPQPVIIFKYDRKAHRYIPANHTLQEYSLKNIATDIGRLNPNVDQSDISSTEGYYYHRVSILLQYIFAGKARDGWEFFDKHYSLADKAGVKAAIQAVLRKQPAYRFIYRSQSRSRG
jgi:hypothetical protein